MNRLQSRVPVPPRGAFQALQKAGQLIDGRFRHSLHHFQIGPSSYGIARGQPRSHWRATGMLAFLLGAWNHRLLTHSAGSHAPQPPLPYDMHLNILPSAMELAQEITVSRSVGNLPRGLARITLAQRCARAVMDLLPPARWRSSSSGWHASPAVSVPGGAGIPRLAPQFGLLLYVKAARIADGKGRWSHMAARSPVVLDEYPASHSSS